MTMTRSSLYREAKKLSRELNVELTKKWNDRGSTKAFWENEVNRLSGINSVNQEREKLSTFFENQTDKSAFTLNNIVLDDALDLIKINPNYFIKIQIGDQFYLLSRNEQLEKIQGLTGDSLIEIMNREGGSDQELIEQYVRNPDTNVTFTIQRKDGTEIKDGGYFEYTHNLKKVDLSRYGFFHTVDKKNYKINCLERALKNAGIKDFNKVTTLFNNRHIPKKNLKQVAEILNITISLNYDVNAKKPKYEIYNKGAEKLVKIALYEKHYFLIEKTNYTTYSIKNYFDICDKENFNEIYGKGDKRDKKRFATSLDIFKVLMKNKETHLKQIDLNDGILRTQFYDKNPTLTDLTVNKGDCARARNYEIKNCFRRIEYFDFEATTDENIHKPYLICSVSRCGEKKFFKGNNCPIYFLKSIREDTLFIAHNLRYDLQFLIPYLTQHKKLIKTGNKIKSLEAKFYNKDLNKTFKLKFKDSYALITMPLKKFGKCFNLKQHKEIMPYEAFNKKTVTESKISIDYACQFLKEEDHNQFKENIAKWGLSEGFNNHTDEWGITENYEYFNHIEYSRKYCEIDCDVLKQGYEIFRKWMLEVTKPSTIAYHPKREEASEQEWFFEIAPYLETEEIDIDGVISIPQLANKFGLDEGCFEGVKKLSGVCRSFIQKCVEGGRVMTRDNKKWHREEKIQDFDGVSLYPSAMRRIEGFLMGTPKVISQKQIEYFDYCRNQWDGYFVEIEVLDVGKKLHFPLLTKKDENGIRQYSNDLRGRGFYVDKTKLEDLIEFQKIEYKVIRGYYFNQGRNDRINTFIQHLFDERQKKKNEGNPIQQVYKLIMNAFYGKTIMNPIEHDFKFVQGKEKIEKHIQKYCNYIHSYTPINENLIISKLVKPISGHSSMPHVGAEILSMSKRIMNEVMCLAEDENIMMYYTDTDSIHMVNSGVEPLANAFREKYGRELIGENLGQFNCDFDFKSDETPYAIESIFLGKKCYLDKVRVINSGIEEFKYHIRMKGIPTSCVLEKGEPMETYQKLHDGEKIPFNLINSCKFKSNPNFTTSNNQTFMREIQF